MFRSRPAQHIDLLIKKESADCVFRQLASAQAVELEMQLPRGLPFAPMEIRDIELRLQRLVQFRTRFEAYLPTPQHAGRSMTVLSLQQTLARLEAAFAAWSRQAEPVIAHLNSLQAEHRELTFSSICIAALPEHGLDLRYFHIPAGNGSVHYVPWLARVQRDASEFLARLPQDTLVQIYTDTEMPEEKVLLGLSPQPLFGVLTNIMRLQQIHRARLPLWLRGSPREALEALHKARTTLENKLQSVQHSLQRLIYEHDLSTAVGTLENCLWLQSALRRTGSYRDFVWITGWVAPDKRKKILRQLETEDIAFVCRISPASAEQNPPVVTSNPGWLKNFELFVLSFGTPSDREVDPTPLLGILAPLLFGYMFGDVGQGAVLLLCGLLLHSRYPALRLLIPAGAAAIVFGMLFGSVFFNEQWLAPLWKHPLDNPLLVLLLPMLVGALILMIGILFHTFNSRWRYKNDDWWVDGASLATVYLGLGMLLASVTMGVVLLGSGIVLRVVAAVWTDRNIDHHPQPFTAVARSLLRLFDQSLQLVLNTLSFIRVGAFAVAHAALGIALLTVMQLADSSIAQALLWLTGNLFAISIEALVVSVQTTRLIMFEFFRRFLRADGRPLRPLHLPQANRLSTPDIESRINTIRPEESRGEP